MAVDLMSSCGGGGGAYEHLAFQEAAAAGLRSLELLASSLSPRAESPPLGQIADQAVSRFRRVINLLDRTGHARFRRAPAEPVEPDTTPLPAPLTKATTFDFTKPSPAASGGTSTSFLSSVTAGGEGSVSKGCSLLAAPAVSSGKPPLPKRKAPAAPAPAPAPCPSASDAGRCHCSKKKKRSRQGLARRTVRVPANAAAGASTPSPSPSSQAPASSDIPADDFSWRKYGQKPIKGSPYPRGYYRCSTAKGCPARKHVERAADDPAMLVVTYEGDHRHDAVVAA
ncbi:hypothetical protein U9M48_040319 [Paspalum notatum var. saurae]|uniref:WRKY domain-containing protein n=1 Tax=Paspalum notatum var. saurae TaxID=547442 RepID=A0AAQ3ULU4_PASNO